MSPTPHVYALVDIGPGDGMSDSLLGVFGTREQAEAEIEECVRDGFPNTALWWQIREIKIQQPPEPKEAEPCRDELSATLDCNLQGAVPVVCGLPAGHSGDHRGPVLGARGRLNLWWDASEPADRTEAPV